MRGKPVVFDNFSGGVNKEAAPYAIDASQARDVLNITTTPIGSIKKRGGFHTVASPTLPVTCLGTYERGSTRYLVGIGDSGASTDIYSFTQAGTETSRKGAATVTTGRRWDFIQAPVSTGEGPIYMINGLDPALQWTGTGNVAAWTPSTGTVPNGKYIIYHDNRVMIAGVETNYTTRSTLYSSNLADPRDWASPGGATNIFDPDDGEEITGLGTVGPYALVFKPRKCFRVHDSDTLHYNKISSTRGSIAHHSIINTDSGTFFLTSDNTICVTDGSSIEHISKDVDPLLKTLSSTTAANAVGFYHDDRYYLSFSTATVNDTIIEFDTRTSSWWIHKIYLNSSTTTGVNGWALLDPQGTATLYAAGASTSTPRIFEAFKANTFKDRSDSDSASTFPAYWITGWNSFESPHIRKILRQIRADAKGEHSLYLAKSFSTAYNTQDSLTWEIANEGSTTFGGGANFGGTGTFGDQISISEKRYYTPATGRAFSLKFESNDSQDWELYSYTMALDTRTD